MKKLLIILLFIIVSSCEKSENISQKIQLSISSETSLKVVYKGKTIIYDCRHAEITDNVLVGDTFRIECYSRGKINFWMYKFRSYQYSECKKDTLIVEKEIQ